ncbi:MAG: carbohydrate ABC transporter permease [Clostridiales bacterium]|nr:carbohydrate ABC transporter permease [Clostridiales bacterium]
MEIISKQKKRNKINQTSGITDFFLNFGFITYSMLVLAPLVLMVMVSVTDESTLNLNGFSFFPQKFNLASYHYIFAAPAQLLRSYGVTIFITIFGTLLSVFISALLAYPISKKNFRLRGFYTFILIVPLLFSGGLVPWYMVYSSFLHLKDTILVLMLPGILSPFFVIIIRTFFTNSVPDSIAESAKIDGASEYRIFFRIILPLSTPVLATVAMFDILGYWNEWFSALMFISKKELMPLQYILYKVYAQLTFMLEMSSSTLGQFSGVKVQDVPNQSARMALVIVTVGPVILAYPFFQKYFVKGLTLGSLKG